MPYRSAARGPSIVTGAPSISIVPESAGCAPARIFMSVDLPAPFSPTSACTSARSTSRSTPSRARTPGKVFTIPRIRSSGLLIALLCVGFRKLSDVNGDLLRRRLPRKERMNGVDRLHADLIGVLNRIAVHLPILDGGPRFRGRVVAHDDDLSRQIRGLNRFGGSERGVVVDPEDALEIFVRLQEIFHNGAGFVAFPAAADVGDDFGVRTILRQRPLEAFDAILNARNLRLVDDRNGSGMIRQAGAHQFSGLLATLDVVARDMRHDGACFCRARNVSG